MPEVSEENFALISAEGELGLSHSIQRTLFEAGTEWVKTSPRVYVDTFGEADAKFGFQTGRRKSTALFLDTMTNVSLVWSHFFVIDGAVQTIFYMDPVDRRLRHLIASAGAPHTSGIDTDGENFFIARRRLNEAVHVPGPTLFASNDDIDAWGMWLWYTLPAVMHFVENRHKYRNLVVSAAHKNMVDMLHLLGVRDEEVIILNYSQVYLFDELCVFRKAYTDFIIWEEARSSYRRIADIARVRTTARDHKKIFVSRRINGQQTGSRNLAEEPQLVEGFSAKGFTIIEPANMTVTEQISAFSRAEIIAGLGGSGMFNTVFCKPGTQIIDIESGTLFINAHANLFSSVGLDYSIIIGREDPTDTRKYHKRWSIDVAKTLHAVDQLLS
jgi:capsular polysaccharide biosynthesis protein